MACCNSIFVSCKKGCTRCTLDFIDNGLDITERDNQKCIPLHYACYYDRKECVKLLLERDTNFIDARDITGRTPLHDACCNGYEDCTENCIES